MRHFAQAQAPRKRLGYRAFAEWLASIDGEGIDGPGRISADLDDALATSCQLIVSPLARATDTATVLRDRPSANATVAVTVSDELREAALPVLPIPYLQLRANTWTVVCRIVWLLGYARGVESRCQTRDRARKAAQELVSLSRAGPVVAVAHGYINVQLAAELRRSGWKGRRVPHSHNGAMTTYTNCPRPPMSP